MTSWPRLRGESVCSSQVAAYVLRCRNYYNGKQHPQARGHKGKVFE